MSMRMLILLVVVGLFGVLTIEALLDVGYFGIFTPHFQSWAGGQVLADLVVMAPWSASGCWATRHGTGCHPGRSSW